MGIYSIQIYFSKNIETIDTVSVSCNLTRVSALFYAVYRLSCIRLFTLQCSYIYMSDCYREAFVLF